MKDPELFSIGIERESFSMMLFFKWCIYAFWHAWAVFFIVYYCLNVPG